MRVNPLQRYPSDLARCKNDIAQLSGRLFVFHDAFKPWYLTSSYCQRRRGQSLPYSFIKTTWDVRCNYTNGWPRETSSTMCTGITKDSLVRIPTSFFCSLFCFIIFRFIGLVFDLFYCHGIAIQQLKTPLNWTNLSDLCFILFAVYPLGEYSSVLLLIQLFTQPLLHRGRFHPRIGIFQSMARRIRLCSNYFLLLSRHSFPLCRVHFYRAIPSGVSLFIITSST